MRRVFTIVSLFFFLADICVYGQTISGSGNGLGKGVKKKTHVKWKTNPFDKQVFIENRGQFDDELPGGPKVYYVVRMGDIQAFFTDEGIIYRLKKYPKLDVSKGQDPDKGGPPKPVIKYVYSQWKGASINAIKTGGDKLSYYYTYPSGMSGTIKTNVFKTITYRNLYPGIDVQYSFKPGKTGIEYKLIVHPGADISQAHLFYGKGSGSSQVNTNGSIDIKTNMGLFNMSSPQGFYRDDNSPLKVSYLLNGNEESLSVENPDAKRTYVIDPWITNPLFSDTDKAYDLDYDNYGNVYVYGGDASPYQLIKLNSVGAIQWVFNATLLTSSTNFYGDVAVDRVTAESYLVEGWNAGGGARAEKINTLGLLMATFPGDNNLGEMYRIEYDACNRDIVVGGGGTTYPYQACILDTAMISIVPVNIEGVNTGYHDIALLSIDPGGNICYMASTQSLVYIGVQNNYMIKLPLPSLSPSILDVFDGFSFHEIGSVTYVAGTDNGFNGMAASPNWLYMYNGDTLQQVNKTTGALNKLLPLNVNLNDYQWGGLDVDACDDIYLGFRDSIKIYNSSLEPEDSLALGAGNTIYDLHLGQHNLIYACGLNFVSSIDVPNPPKLISSAAGTPSSCSACNGTASVTINCGISPYSFKWSDGNTNQTDTGLCPGVYQVIVSDAACPPNVDTATVSVPGENGFSVTLSDTNPDCGLKKGNATAHVTGGNPPYTYLWSNGETNQTDTGLVAGTYTCVVRDNSGCIYVVSITLVNPRSPDVAVVPAKDSLCVGSSIPLVVSGAKTYKWTPSQGLSCNSCSNPVASPTVTTVYTVVGTDSIGCKDSNTCTLKVYTVPKPTITGRDSVCSGYTDTLTASGANKYLWSTGATTTSIDYHAVTTKTITVTAYNGMCSHDTSFVIHVVSPAAKIVPSKDSICKGDSVNLLGSGGVTYKWSIGNTSKSIWVKPVATQTYTLYAYEATCKDSATIKIRLIPSITGTVSATRDSICPHGTTVITAKGIGGQATYKWNTGATSSSIIVTDTVTTTYTAEVYGLCDSTQVIKTIIVVPLPAPTITGDVWKCKGQRDTLLVSSAFNPTKYVWSNGRTSTSIVTGDINADSSFYVTAYNSLGCSVIDTFNVGVKPYPNANLSYPPGCGNTQTTITADATGTGPFTYKWSNGGTYDTINVFITDTTVYNVTISNGCPITRTITVIQDVPSLSACCNTSIFQGNSTGLSASGNNIVKYQWYPDNGLSCDTCANPTASPTVTTTYTVIGTDAAGCTNEQIITIVVDLPCFNLLIPNVFTPTESGVLGLDNVFYIKTENMDAWSLTIYDRWGKEMYKSSNPNEYWEGNTEGGAKASAGVYYYIINATCQQTTYKKDGFVQLIR